MNVALSRLGYILFVALWLELALGGGGRLTAIGPVSLRMILFGLAITLSVLMIAKGASVDKRNRLLLSCFCLVMIIGITRGVWNGAPTSTWWEDVKPLLYFLILPFIQFVFEDSKAVKATINVVKVSAVIQTIAFISILVLIHTHAVPFLSFYKPAIASTEFFFRGEITFFYKGFVFLCLGWIAFFLLPSRFRPIAMIVVGFAILACLTRGFIFAMALTFAVYFFSRSRWKFSIAMVVAAITLVFGGRLVTTLSEAIDYFRRVSVERKISSPQEIDASSHQQPVQQLNPNLLGDRKFADDGRETQIKEVLRSVSLSSFFIGHGFGIGIPSRPVHMEISYLEIFHKQGLLGLLFWLIVLLCVYRAYRVSDQSPTAQFFFLSALFIYFQSLTNQYVNNPIGLSVVLVALVALTTRGKNDATLLKTI